MSEKTQVLIIPENHSEIGQKSIELYIPFILDIFRRKNIKDINVLNYTEGDDISNIYKSLYTKDEVLQFVKEKTIDGNSIDLYNSIKHGLKIINLIKNTFDYYKCIRIKNPTEVPIGLWDLPMNSKYINILAYNIYQLPQYVPNKQHKYYAYINAIYQNIINNESIETYEEYISGMLNESKQFFTDYLQFFDFHEMIDCLNGLTIVSRNSILNKYSAKLRNILDIRVINNIPEIIKIKPRINMVIIVCGISHFYNMRKLIESSNTLMMEPEFLQIILTVYALSESMGAPNYITAVDGII
jgi:hypothetical protein